MGLTDCVGLWINPWKFALLIKMFADIQETREYVSFLCSFPPAESPGPVFLLILSIYPAAQKGQFPWAAPSP